MVGGGGAMYKLASLATKAALSYLVMVGVFRLMDPDRESTKRKAAEKKMEISKRLGRPLIHTNPYEGAFTGVCSMQHVPSYKNNIDKFKARGIDSVICVAVNDPYVMNGASFVDRRVL